MPSGRRVFLSIVGGFALAAVTSAEPPAAAPPPAAAAPTPQPAAASPAPAAPVPPPGTPAATPAPAPANAPKPAPLLPPSSGGSQAALVDTLNPGELQEAVNLLRVNYVRPDQVNDQAIARATLDGLLGRLNHGAMLLPKPADNGAPSAAPSREPLPDGFASETVEDRTGYVRLGALTRDHLGDLDKALKDFTDKKLPALVLDLRATAGSSDYELAADVLRRFVAKGRPLFTLRKPSNNQDRLFTSNADPAFGGIVLVAVDGDTAGAAETIAAVIRHYDRSLVIGEPTAGQAVEYADLRLSGGTLLRVAVSQVVLPANLSIFPDGVKPDLPVQTPRATKVAVFLQSQGKSIAPFVFETERPRFNEFALVTGVNPEFDAAAQRQAAQREGKPPPAPPLRDPVLQRAFDMATSLPALEPAKGPEGPR
ncbi:MAG: hypothetical protein INR65_10485 [Gluconacetobacter diazotrophicus]|nr:hypothetical protein [Gluconacetobacter diazotrophicus]